MNTWNLSFDRSPGRTGALWVATLAACVMNAGPAHAEISPEKFTTYVSLTSDYRFRGISQSERNPAIQGGVDFQHDNGIFAGVWASTIDFADEAVRSNSRDIEIDYYLGFNKRFASDWSAVLSVVHYAYPDTSFNYDYTELRKNVVAMVDFVGSGKRAGTRDVHGTAIAGVIASQAGNGIGIVGVAPEVEVVALRACWPIRAGATEARCSSFTLAKALEFAIADDVDVLNLSLTGPSDPLLLRLIGVALDRGIIVVAAVDPARQGAGFPASRPGVISVDVAGGDWRRRPTGEVQQFQVVAPGTDVLTTTPEGNFGFLSGSSIAAAHVSGVTALLLERAPHLSHGEVASLLTGSIHKVDGTYSVNACLALADLLQLSGCGSKEMARQ